MCRIPATAACLRGRETVSWQSFLVANRDRDLLDEVHVKPGLTCTGALTFLWLVVHNGHFAGA